LIRASTFRIVAAQSVKGCLFVLRQFFTEPDRSRKTDAVYDECMAAFAVHVNRIIV